MFLLMPNGRLCYACTLAINDWDRMMYINSENVLRELYGYPTVRVKSKQKETLSELTTNFIGRSSFTVISTYDQKGRIDISPRGGEIGFVKVLNEQRLLIPDLRGNNRLDCLNNIIETGSVGCLFFVVGSDETLRVNGRAKISIDPLHLALFSQEKLTPKSCIELNIEEVFLHCTKSLKRAALWSAKL